MALNMRSLCWLAFLLGACGAPPQAVTPGPTPSAPTSPQTSVTPATSAEGRTEPPRPATPEEATATSAPSRIDGPHWQALGGPSDSPITYSANGKWYAVVTSEGLIVGDSETWQPLSMVALNIDKAGQALFHPSSQFVVVTYDFYLEIFEVQSDAVGMTLMVSDPPLPWQETPALNPLAFDYSGKHLAAAASAGAIVFDFDQRKPIARLLPQFVLEPSGIGFSRDQLFLTQSSSAPCRCDDFGGSGSGIAAWKVGSPKMRARPLQGDLGSLCHLRQGTLVAGGNLWDLRSGRRLIQHRLRSNEVVMEVYRLRSSRRWVGLVHDSTRSPETHLGLFGGGGRHRELGPVSVSAPQGLSVRPQDDLAVFLEYDYGPSGIHVHTIPISGGSEQVVALPAKICLHRTRVVPDPNCRGAPDAGTHWQRSPEAPGLDDAVPTIEAPELPRPKTPPGLIPGLLREPRS
jgi:hypothetical protein